MTAVVAKQTCRQEFHLLADSGCICVKRTFVAPAYRTTGLLDAAAFAAESFYPPGHRLTAIAAPELDVVVFQALIVDRWICWEGQFAKDCRFIEQPQSYQLLVIGR